MEKFKSRREREEERQRSQKTTPAKTLVEKQVWYKRKWTIVAGGVLLATVIVLVVLMVLLTVATNNRTEDLRQARDQSRAHLVEMEGMSGDGSREQRLEKLDAWLVDLEELKCGSKVRLPWLADIQQQCQDFNATRTAAKERLESTRYLLRYDVALEEALAPVVRDSEVEDVTAELAAWQEVVRQIEQLPHADIVGETQARLVERTTTIRDTWEQLKVANDEENSESFRELEESLPEKYSNLQMVREELERAYDIRQSELVQAVKTHHQE